jgi:TetR/AcrR family transcriptional repressor of nem operon
MMGRPLEFDVREALHNALGVFWRKGYEGTSLTELLNATGLSKSSLYGAFGGKRELFLAAFDAYRADRAAEMEIVLVTGPARQAVANFFENVLRDAKAKGFSNGCMSINQAVEMAPHDPEVKARVQSDFQLIEDALARTIERGQHEGSIMNRRTPRELARLLVVMFPGLQVMVRAGGSEDRLSDALKTLLSNLD